MADFKRADLFLNIRLPRTDGTFAKWKGIALHLDAEADSAIAERLQGASDPAAVLADIIRRSEVTVRSATPADSGDKPRFAF